MNEYAIILICFCAFGCVAYFLGKSNQKSKDITHDINQLWGAIRDAKADSKKIDDMSHDERIAFLRTKKP